MALQPVLKAGHLWHAGHLWNEEDVEMTGLVLHVNSFTPSQLTRAGCHRPAHAA